MVTFYQNNHSTRTALAILDAVLNVLITDMGDAPGEDLNPLLEDFIDLLSFNPSSMIDDHANFQVALSQKTAADDIKWLMPNTDCVYR
jgi:hypothetical protein